MRRYKHASSHSLVCGAVDNHLARRELARVHGLVLDCGNHVDSGQVVLGNTDDLDRVTRSIQNGRTHYLPNAALLFPQLLEPEPMSEPKPVPTATASCADLLETAEQSLLVNDMVGIIAGEYVYKLLNRLPVFSFLTYVDTESLSMRSVPITVDNLKPHVA